MSPCSTRKAHVLSSKKVNAERAAQRAASRRGSTIQVRACYYPSRCRSRASCLNGMILIYPAPQLRERNTNKLRKPPRDISAAV